MSEVRSSRRPPRAARARRTATAVSVAAMLSLGGALAWRDGATNTTTKASPTASRAAATADSSTSSAASADSSASASSSTTSHTVTSGS